MNCMCVCVVAHNKECKWTNNRSNLIRYARLFTEIQRDDDFQLETHFKPLFYTEPNSMHAILLFPKIRRFHSVFMDLIRSTEETEQKNKVVKSWINLEDVAKNGFVPSTHFNHFAQENF